MKSAIQLLLAGFLLIGSCTGRDSSRPPGRDEVFAVRDSMRTGLLLRIGRAQQEINRQAEAMRNRAYDADRATARRLNEKIDAIEKSYEKLEQQARLLREDSLMGDWILMEQETELLIIEAGRELGVSF